MTYLPELFGLLQILLIDLSMAGDNAVVVGMAAAGLPQAKRHKAVMAGIAGATISRIFFALFAVQILHITGLLAAGGLLLLWVAWKMWGELRHLNKNSSPLEGEDAKTWACSSKPLVFAGEGGEGEEKNTPSPVKTKDLLRKSKFSLPPPPGGRSSAEKTLSAAIWQIIIADVSMSLDNVLGVAGVARDHIGILVIGLTLSVVLMGAASAFVARLAARHHWVGYLGLVVILYTALKMVWDGAQPFFN